MSGKLNDVSVLEDRYFKKEYWPDSNLAITAERVSTKVQELRSSLQVQGERAKEYVKKMKLQVEEDYSYSETAYLHEERKIFNEIIKKIKKSQKSPRKIMHLVFSHASRASRNKLSTATLRELVLVYGIVLHYYRENLILHKYSDQAVWDRWEKLHASSEEDNNERRRNALSGMLLKYQKGIPQQKSPLGYSTIKVGKFDHAYVFNPPFSSYMERAFHLAATGDANFKQKLDREFIGIIDPKKIPNARQLMTALRDPFFYGDFRVKGVIFQGNRKYLPPLIKKSLWRTVQIILDGKNRDTRSSKKDLAYTGTIKCGGDILDADGMPTGEICGGSISGEVKGHNGVITWGCGCSRKNCSQRKASYMRSIGANRYYSNDKIEEMLAGIIGSINLNSDMLLWFKSKVEATVLEQSDFNKNKISKIHAGITKKEEMRKKVFMQKIEGKRLPAEYEEIDRELVDEIKMLKEKLIELKEEKIENDWIQEAIMQKIINLVETFKNAPGAIKNKMVLSFCKKIVLRHGQLIPEFKSFL